MRIRQLVRFIGRYGLPVCLAAYPISQMYIQSSIPRDELFEHYLPDKEELRKIEEQQQKAHDRLGNNAGSGWVPFLDPILRRWMDPEMSHNVAVSLLANRLLFGSMLSFSRSDASRLRTNVLGMEFDNPVGIAAGFDKNAVAVDGLFQIGFGFVEVGSVTPLPQAGNERPRVFRLVEDEAVINRYGFNSDGIVKVSHNLDGSNKTMMNKIWSFVEEKTLSYSNNNKKIQQRNDRLSRRGVGGAGVVGVNLGVNRDNHSTKAAISDYIKGMDGLLRFADYIVINVSCPNSPGVTDLQHIRELHSILSAVKQHRDSMLASSANTSTSTSAALKHVPLLVKLSPDLNSSDRKEIAALCLDVEIDGLIISNTSSKRPEFLMSENKNEKGGLSGLPLRDSSTELVRDMYALTNGHIPIIGVGGIRNGDDAYAKIRAGSSLVQLYTGFVYGGPSITRAINLRLSALLARDGFDNVAQAVGADHFHTHLKVIPVSER